MKVSEVMRPSTAWVAQNGTLTQVVGAFLRYRVDLLPIVDAAEHVVGVISPVDLLHLLFPRFDNILRDYSALEDKGQLSSLFGSAFAGIELDDNRLILAADIMRTNLIWISVDDSLISAAARLFNQNVRALPVVDRDRRLLGLLSDTDLVLALLKGSAAPTPR